jgi:hypothetical protein
MWLNERKIVREICWSHPHRDTVGGVYALANPDTNPDAYPDHSATLDNPDPAAKPNPATNLNSGGSTGGSCDSGSDPANGSH